MKNVFRHIIIPLFFLFVGAGGTTFGQEITIHFRSPESAQDHRLDFVNELIIAVMDRTIQTDGPYKMKPIPKMVFNRLAFAKTQERFPNFVIRFTGDRYTAKHFEVVPIPINRGIVGYRLCLIHASMQGKFSEISKLSDMISMGLKAGQGHWTDVDILEENGIRVEVGTDYEGLFGMLMGKRFDFFPRGINEIFQELENRKELYPEMRIEKTMALHYPLPRVLVTNKGNARLANRIERGLISIFSDGTHRKIWLKHNRDWIRRVELGQRKIFRLKNSTAMPDLPYDQKEYWYQPGEAL